VKIIHKFQSHGDHRDGGQTEHEYTHSTACGYVRGGVTFNDEDVNCPRCRKIMGLPIRALWK
jgi:hypothetical protein